MLEPQLYIGDEPTGDLFHCPTQSSFPESRPGGGFWTSTLVGGRSAWSDHWPWSKELRWWIVQPHAQAKILEIRTPDDVGRAVQRWPWRDSTGQLRPDFRSIKAAGYWGVHDRSGVLEDWQVESTFWLRFDFFTSYWEIQQPSE
jgi:hypothetical protein